MNQLVIPISFASMFSTFQIYRVYTLHSNIFGSLVSLTDVVTVLSPVQIIGSPSYSLLWNSDRSVGCVGNPSGPDQNMLYFLTTERLDGAHRSNSGNSEQTRSKLFSSSVCSQIYLGSEHTQHLALSF